MVNFSQENAAVVNDAAEDVAGPAEEAIVPPVDGGQDRTPEQTNFESADRNDEDKLEASSADIVGAISRSCSTDGSGSEQCLQLALAQHYPDSVSSMSGSYLVANEVESDAEVNSFDDDIVIGEDATLESGSAEGNSSVESKPVDVEAGLRPLVQDNRPNDAEPDLQGAARGVVPPVVEAEPVPEPPPLPPRPPQGLGDAHQAMMQGGGPTGFQPYNRPNLFPFRVSGFSIVFAKEFHLFAVL